MVSDITSSKTSSHKLEMRQLHITALYYLIAMCGHAWLPWMCATQNHAVAHWSSLRVARIDKRDNAW